MAMVGISLDDLKITFGTNSSNHTILLNSVGFVVVIVLLLVLVHDCHVAQRMQKCFRLSLWETATTVPSLEGSQMRVQRCPCHC